MRLGQSLSFAAASLIFAGCFAPDETVDLETDGAADESTAAGGTEDTAPATTASATGGMTTTNPTGATTGGPTTGPTTEEPTTGNPTTDEPTTEDTSDPTSGGENPFCGDGNVDAGEECDDGLENNGLDQGCLPDCNLNVCGDSNIGPDEFCDDGEDDNVLEVGACAPDCSTVVEEKVIRLGDSVLDGDLGNNPVATADGTCEVGYGAIFAYPGLRRATTTANSFVDPLDWVLQPWTFYVRPSGELIWATGAVPLLGVRDGATQPLENAVSGFDAAGTSEQVLTGLEGDWTTAVSSTCDGWTSTAASVRPGNPLVVTNPAFLRGAQSTSCEGLTVCPGFPLVCSSFTNFYCAEQ